MNQEQKPLWWWDLQVRLAEIKLKEQKRNLIAFLVFSVLLLIVLLCS